jgi:hypothetical protein
MKNTSALMDLWHLLFEDGSHQDVDFVQEMELKIMKRPAMDFGFLT